LHMSTWLAGAKCELGAHREAEDVLRRNAEIQSRSLGAQDIYYVATLRNLARVLNKQERFEEARRAALQAVARTSELSQAHFGWRVRCLAELARAQLGLEMNDAAEIGYSGISPWLTGEDCWLPHPLVSEILNDHATLLRRLGRDEEADEIINQAENLPIKLTF
jgi:tetratricopeptide (TPR) repeat protein